MLIISDFQSAWPVSLFGAPVVRDRHAGWRGADSQRSPWHTPALVTERDDLVHRATKRNPLVPRPRARLD